MRSRRPGPRLALGGLARRMTHETRAAGIPGRTPAANNHHSIDSVARARVHAALDALLDAFAGLAAAPVTTTVPETTTAPLLSAAALAARLDVSIATVRRLDAAGQPRVMVGDSARYDLAEVLAWHRSRDATPKPPTQKTGDVVLLSRRRK